ncbi:hypothetical protein EYB53_017170 [Candidatus Chloroploca sp. M-50]|uniref:Predicted pPIWI-associating nuclease domain-containing protein n=1 Tax=Candidatus Chloroploca mongolica TaxID=2528176 RepID=A0ABS4DDD0_9CHLR|nr:hypothetical protein [Candidatus Chloroploca mongolica]MBP1467448.1 hypothetical protein [Candidatus Chloroploca mongolica]
MSNPYSWNSVNPTLFYGQDRIDLLIDMIDGLTGSPRSSFGVTGSRRIGKTTLLRRLEQDLSSGHEQWKSGGVITIPIYIDGLVLPRPLSPGYLWYFILSEITLKLRSNNTCASCELDFAGFKQYLQPVLSELSERPRVIVLFDEVEPIMIHDWSGGFFAQWRAMLSNSPGMSEFFTAVFAGAREMTELQRDVGSPLKDILEWRVLRTFDFEDSCLMMQDPMGITWSDEFLQFAYQQTGGHPMLLQYAMQKVISQTKDPDKAVSVLNQAIQKFSINRSWHFEEWFNRYCTPTARRIYSMMPEDGTAIPLRDIVREFGVSEANAATEILQHVGIVVSEDDGMLFRYSGEMFRNWFRKYGSVEDTIEHDHAVYLRLARVQSEHDLAEKYLTAWKTCQASLPNYSGAVSEIRDTFTLVLQALAPDEQVKGATDFKPEPGQTRPTRRQKVRYLARERYNKITAAEIENDTNLFEVLLSELAVNAYNAASALTHTSATRESAFEILKRWDTILKRLLPE